MQTLLYISPKDWSCLSKTKGVGPNWMGVPSTATRIPQYMRRGWSGCGDSKL